MHLTVRQAAFVLAVVCPIAAGTPVASGGKSQVSYKSGRYSGRTGQVDPTTNTGKRFRIAFKIAGGRISGVETHTLDSCPDGTRLRVHQNAFKSGTIGPKGGFKLKAGTAEEPAILRGTVNGKDASGKLTDNTNDPDTGGHCSASTTWSATHRKKK
jgi:hypothetical protein